MVVYLALTSYRHCPTRCEYPCISCVDLSAIVAVFPWHTSMDFDYFGILFQVVFWIVAMTFMMRWFARSRLRDRPASEARTLRQPTPLLIVGIVCLAMSIGMLYGSYTETGGPIPFVVGCAMTVLSLYLISDYYLARHVIDDDGMAYGRTLGKRGYFRWSDVRRVAFNKRMNWYRLELESGVMVRVTGMQMGLPEFAAHVLRHVPAARIDPRAHDLLEHAARGKLHRIWP
ncbi:PH domain-containing protein [Massilia arenae]|uniref:PH domain-containing protein n=2 Tax=Massilia arenae TaxID=2603288 RepID=A0A5C7FVY0_9BURK|nr:PH domain-containing protein [Massilia arenae]